MRSNLLVVLMAFCLSVMMSLTGCGGDAGRTAPSSQQDVGSVLQEQTKQDEGHVSEKGTFVGDSSPAFKKVDYDLTAMSSDMVYATVFDMVTNSSGYEGKIVRMKGPYQHVFFEATKKDYFYVVIQDATACCSQGLEFVWGDGSHAYPDDYPKDGTEVVVTGKFSSYVEESNNYIHLTDASLEAAQSA